MANSKKKKWKKPIMKCENIREIESNMAACDKVSAATPTWMPADEGTCDCGCSNLRS